MSYIDSVIITGADPENILTINKWLTENDTDRKQQFHPINMDEAGGTKYFSTSVYAAAFNYVPTGLFDLLSSPVTWGINLYGVHIVWDGEYLDCLIAFDSSGVKKLYRCNDSYELSVRYE